MRRFKFNLFMKNGDELADIISVGETPEKAYDYLKSNEKAQEMINFNDVDHVDYTEIPYEEVDPDNYKFEKSKLKEGYYVVTDLRHNIVTSFPRGKFNSEQRHTQLFDNKLGVTEMATVMRELGEYLYKYHRAETGV